MNEYDRTDRSLVSWILVVGWFYVLIPDDSFLISICLPLDYDWLWVGCDYFLDVENQ